MDFRYGLLAMVCIALVIAAGCTGASPATVAPVQTTAPALSPHSPLSIPIRDLHNLVPRRCMQVYPINLAGFTGPIAPYRSVTPTVLSHHVIHAGDWS